jgi:hypothetical protein
MKSDWFRQLTVLVAILLAIAVTIAANALPLNGQTTSEVTAKYPTFFTPADYAFSVWALIYLGLLSLGIYQVLPNQKENPRLRAISPWLVLNCLALSLWLVLWSYESIALSLVAMLLMLSSAIAIYRLLRKTSQSAPQKLQTNVSLEVCFVDIPISIYLAWLTVTTIANAATALSHAQWNDWGISPEWWTVAMAIASLGIIGTIAIQFTDIPYTATIIWAYVAIALKYHTFPLVFYSIAIAASLALILLLFSVVFLQKRAVQSRS